MIEDVILTTENCRYCLMCRHVCPVGHVTRLETLTPHGWGLTISSIRRGTLQIDDSTVGAIYSCADCGTCRANCVTDQPLPAAIAAMRSEIAAGGQAPPAVYEAQAKLERYSNPYAEQKPEQVDGQGEVALFVGDDAHYLGQEALQAALRLLKQVGVKPVLIGIGRNNGYLASSLGFPQMSFDLAMATLTELESSGAGSMMVLTPGDYYVFRQMHDERHGLAWPKGVTVQEVIPFLAEHLGLEIDLIFEHNSMWYDIEYSDASGRVIGNLRYKLKFGDVRIPILIKGVLDTGSTRISLGIGPEFVISHRVVKVRTTDIMLGWEV